jgi:hypothetical protein
VAVGDVDLLTVEERLQVLKEALAEVLQTLGSAPRGPAAQVRPWNERATPQEWDELRAWVAWLSSSYGIRRTSIRPCWEAHVGPIEELAALHSGWRQNMAAMMAGDTDAMSYWHDRCLFPTLDRLGARYDLEDCKGGHLAGLT